MSLESLGSRLGAFGSLMENYLVEWHKQIPQNREQRVTLEALLSDRVGRPPEKAAQTQKRLKKKRKLHKQDQPQMSISMERKPSFGTPSRDDSRPPMPLQPPTRARSAYEIFKLKARHLFPAHLSPEKVEMRLKMRWMQLRLSDKMVGAHYSSKITFSLTGRTDFWCFGRTRPGKVLEGTVPLYDCFEEAQRG